MRQIQTFILEKSDLSCLKNGDPLTITLSNGNSIEIIYNARRRKSKDVDVPAQNGQEEFRKLNPRKIPRRIFEYLKDKNKPISFGQIMKDNKIASSASTASSLKQLLKKHFIKKVEHGQYAVNGAH